MSLVWKLNKTQYGPDGLVSLFQGDDWNLDGKVVDLIGSYEAPVDMSPYAATGYFPSASGGADLPFPAATGVCGSLAVSVPAASGALVLQNTGGSGAYVVVQNQMTGKLQTIPTIDQAVVILARGFVP